MTTPELPNHSPRQQSNGEGPQGVAVQPQLSLAEEQASAPASVVPEAPERKPLNKTLLIAAASFVLGAMLGVAGTALVTSAIAEANTKSEAAAAAKAEAEKPRPLKNAATDCAITKSKGAKLGDNETSLSLDGMGNKDSYGLSMTAINCVLDSVKVPDFVRAQMDKTRALDGTQRESWGNLSATWSYHPDSGFNVGLTEK